MQIKEFQNECELRRALVDGGINDHEHAVYTNILAIIHHQRPLREMISELIQYEIAAQQRAKKINCQDLENAQRKWSGEDIQAFTHQAELYAQMRHLLIN